MWHAYSKQQYGRMTKLLQKMYEEKNQRDYLEELQHVVKAKEWNHIDDVLQKVIVFAYPSNFRLF